MLLRRVLLVACSISATGSCGKPPFLRPLTPWAQTLHRTNMRAVAVWGDKVHDREGVKQTIYAICFKPDGTQLIAGAGHRVLVRRFVGVRPCRLAKRARALPAGRPAGVRSRRRRAHRVAQGAQGAPPALSPPLANYSVVDSGHRTRCTAWPLPATASTLPRAARTRASSSGPRRSRASCASRASLWARCFWFVLVGS